METENIEEDENTYEEEYDDVEPQEDEDVDYE